MQKKNKMRVWASFKGKQINQCDFSSMARKFFFFFLLMTPTPDKSTMLDLSTIKNILCPYHICISRFFAPEWSKLQKSLQTS